MGRLKKGVDAARAGLSKRDEVIATPGKIRLYPFELGRTEGTRVFDTKGKSYWDWEGSVCVALTGYRHPRISDAIRACLDREYSQLLAVYPNEPAIALAERLVALTPGDFAKAVWFGSSGSDALDCLVKLAPSGTARTRLVSYIGAHHGTTVGAGWISGEGIQARFPAATNVVKAPYPYPYRCAWGPCDPEECSLKCLRFLEDQVLGQLVAPEEVAALFFEPIQSFGGEIVPPSNYPPALADLCDRYGIWLVSDEVKTGLGRTGRMFAAEHWGLEADAIALGKPLGGGLPLSAVVARREIFDGRPLTAQALAGSPMPCAAGLASLDVIEDEDLAGNAERVGAVLRHGLVDLAGRHPLIGEVRGKGLMIGVELVEDRGTREPATRDTARLLYRCYELGLLLICVGRFGNVLEVTPPLTSTASEIEEALDVLDRALSDVESGRFDDAKLNPVI